MVISKFKKSYSEEYEDEIRLNQVFSQFATNYKAAHEGRNTQKAQIVDAVKKAHLSETECK